MSRAADLGKAMGLITLVLPWVSLRAGDSLREARALIEAHVGPDKDGKQEVITDPEQEIKRGTVVALRSGGPAMTVESITAKSEEVVCRYFLPDQTEPVRRSFFRDTLEVLS